MLVEVSKDIWLSECLGIQSYNLKLFQNDEETISEKSEQKLVDIFENVSFAYAKVNVTERSFSAFLESKGFKLIDTNVVFYRNIAHTNKLQAANEIRFAVSVDAENVIDLAERSFIYSRFHADPLIQKNSADRIKKEWVANYFSGKRGSKMVVAIYNKLIVGFALLLINDRTVVIDLIAVDASVRNKGYASAMINFIFDNFADKSVVKVGTQIQNIPSINLYLKHGFRLLEASYVFHFHSK